MKHEHWADKISFHKADKYKRFIWLKIEFNECPLYLASCPIMNHLSMAGMEWIRTMHLSMPSRC